MRVHGGVAGDEGGAAGEEASGGRLRREVRREAPAGGARKGAGEDGGSLGLVEVAAVGVVRAELGLRSRGRRRRLVPSVLELILKGPRGINEMNQRACDRRASIISADIRRADCGEGEPGGSRATQRWSASIPPPAALRSSFGSSPA